MPGRVWRIALLVLLCRGVGAAPLPAEAFGELPRVSEVSLSPDGKRIAWLNEAISIPQIFVFDVDSSKTVRMLRVEADAKVRALLWSDNSTLLMLLGFTEQHGQRDAARYEFSRVLAFDVSSGLTHQLLNYNSLFHEFVTGDELLVWHPSAPNTVIMSTLDVTSHMGRGWVRNLYAVDTRSGAAKLIAEGPSAAVSWIADRDGNALAYSEVIDKHDTLVLYRQQGKDWKEVARHTGAPLELYHLSGSASEVIGRGPGADGRVRLWSVPLDGSPPRDLLPDASEDVVEELYDSLSGEIVGVQLGGLHSARRWIDPQTQHRNEVLARSFPNRDVLVYGHSEDNTRAVAAVMGPSSPAVFYLVDFATHHAAVVGETYPTLAPATLGEVRAITFKARDGTDIPAYVTLPPGAGDKNLPLVVLPHGGPAARDYPQFDWWAQFLAARGYAVLQVQFRGSTGFGAAWEHAGAGQWGGLMQSDLSDGVQTLVQEGLADAHRVCIVGASYGGYAALAGAAFTPELYACAVSVNGVSDLPLMQQYLMENKGKKSGVVQYWNEQMGNDQLARQRSPARAAAQIHVPVLLMRSSQDSVVPPQQTDIMAEAIKKSGGNVTVVNLEGEDHWLSRSLTRVQMLKALDSFLSANLH